MCQNVFSEDRENILTDTATGLLPQIEEMFPDEPQHVQTDLAIDAALNLLIKVADDLASPITSVD